jgi:hypothetical protein
MVLFTSRGWDLAHRARELNPNLAIVYKTMSILSLGSFGIRRTQRRFPISIEAGDQLAQMPNLSESAFLHFFASLTAAAASAQ